MDILRTIGKYWPEILGFGAIALVIVIAILNQLGILGSQLDPDMSLLMIILGVLALLTMSFTTFFAHPKEGHGNSDGEVNEVKEP